MVMVVFVIFYDIAVIPSPSWTYPKCV